MNDIESMTLPSRTSRRLGHSKSRAGCVTCKKRRIKCGEEKPACLRCTSTGRKCDGYEDIDGVAAWASKTSDVTSLEQDRPLMASEFTDEEHRTFQFFINVAAPQIAGCVEDDFWTRLVPQYSHSEPAVRHAILAIGSLFLQSTLKSSASEFFDNRSLKTTSLRYYNKAIGTTLKALEARRGGEELTAMTCILFVCIEALQGHETEAMELFKKVHRTFAILSGLDDQSNNLSINPGIMTVFSQLTVLCTMFDSNPTRPDILYYIAFFKPIPVSHTHTNSFIQARRELLALVRFVQSIMFVGSNLKWSAINLATHPGAVALRTRQRELHLVLWNWYMRFTEFKEHHSRRAATANENIIASTLTVQYQLISVWLDSSLQRDQLSQDSYMLQFESAISEASTAIDLMRSTGNLSQFTYEMGLIPSLYWTVIRCRDPILRRRALLLLDQAPTQEGLWDKRIIVKVARRVIQLEENSEESCPDTTDTQNIHVSTPYPPEEMRVHVVQIYLRTSLDGRQGDHVNFLSLPRGFTGGWDIRREFIAL